MTILSIDTDLFKDSAIAAETRQANDMVEAILASVPSIMETGAAETRRSRAAGEGLLKNQAPHPEGRWETAAALGLEVPVRVIPPATPARGIYLHIHGGGHVIGSAGAQDQALKERADQAGLVMVSVEYRLAPENPWPAPAEDCEAAALWVIENAKALSGTDKVLIGGESAGAHLSATTILRLKERLGVVPFLAANLVYGVYDMAGTPSVYRWGERNLVINTAIIRWFAAQLVPPAVEKNVSLRDPKLSPLYADLDGLCPALFTVGTLDPLVDDTLLMATRWASADNDTELAIYPGGIHAFNALPGLPIANEANDRMMTYLQSYL
ncbi:MAG: alpha/beta hydrolase [Pseudomonadota bacterium]